MVTSDAFLKILYDLCVRQLYLHPLKNGSSRYGPMGEILRHSVLQEWWISNVVNAEENIFVFQNAGSKERNANGINPALGEEYLRVKQLQNDCVPFGLCETVTSDGLNENGNIFKLSHLTSLRLYFFTHPSESDKWFYHWQRLRKTWWRKFCVSPGRYSLSTPQSGQLNIEAAFPFGNVCVEKLCQSGSSVLEKLAGEDISAFSIRDKRRSVLPAVIETTFSPDIAAMTFLCDAFVQQASTTPPREMLQLHRRLAPYKVTFAVTQSVSAVAQELQDLSRFLTRQLRKAGITTLLYPNVSATSLEKQFLRNDELGIPYTVVLNEKSLKTGIIGLRNRDTTLREQVHIGELSSYLHRILETY